LPLFLRQVVCLRTVDRLPLPQGVLFLASVHNCPKTRVFLTMKAAAGPAGVANSITAGFARSRTITPLASLCITISDSYQGAAVSGIAIALLQGEPMRATASARSPHTGWR
jgi:hypothetical protein